MSSIFKSSIGKKLVMSISGLFLILFLTLHMCINLISVFSEEGFEKACEFMALPIIDIMVPILAAGFAIHIIFAIILTAGNLKARGKVRYEVPNKAATDSFAARNMFVLGLIIFLGLALHLTDFWANMQLKDWMGNEPDNPNMLLANTFGNVRITIMYLLWFAAIWFHLTHGFWSAFQTVGLNNNIWMKRLKWIAYIYVTVLMLGFAVTAVTACVKANSNTLGTIEHEEFTGIDPYGNDDPQTAEENLLSSNLDEVNQTTPADIQEIPVAAKRCPHCTSELKK
ncbi:MAG: succinate dehydrogenase cytochrome b subunit [Bacteroidales bacterium]|nr:succinate dehydrogenase cytochrome b subunit [Bacteroidales bacterium]